MQTTRKKNRAAFRHAQRNDSTDGRTVRAKRKIARMKSHGIHGGRFASDNKTPTLARNESTDGAEEERRRAAAERMEKRQSHESHSFTQSRRAREFGALRCVRVRVTPTPVEQGRFSRRAHCSCAGDAGVGAPTIASQSLSSHAFRHFVWPDSLATSRPIAPANAALCDRPVINCIEM